MTTQTANSRINNYFEKVAIWLGGVVIALLCLAYQDQKSTLNKLESNVQVLFMDKVNKQDLKDLESRWFSRLEATNSETRALIKSSNEDIIARLDLYFKIQKN